MSKFHIYIISHSHNQYEVMGKSITIIVLKIIITIMCVVLFIWLINDIVYFFFVFVDEINGDVEKEEEVVLDFTVHDSNV